MNNTFQVGQTFRTLCRRSGLVLILVSTPMAMAAYLTGKQALTHEQPSSPVNTPEQVDDAPTSEMLPIPSKQAPYEQPDSHTIA